MATFLTTDDVLFLTEMNEKRLLKAIIRTAPLTKSIPEDKFAEESGVDVYFRGRNPLDPVDGATAESVQLTDPVPVQLTSRKIKGTLYTLQNSVNPSWLEKKVTFDGLKSAHELLVGNIKESVEKHNVKMIVPDIITFLADWDLASPYQKQFAATGGSTSSVAAASILTQGDDYWNPSYVMPISKNNVNYGQQRLGDTFTTADDTLTVASPAWNAAVASGDLIHIANVAGLTTGDKITVEKIGYIMSYLGEGSLDILGTEGYTYPNPHGYGFRVFMGSLDHGDLTRDTDYKAWSTYNDKSDGFKKWSVGNVYSNEIMKYAMVYRESTARAFSATGAIWSVIGLGPQCAKRKVLQQPFIEIVGGRGRADSNNVLGKKIFMSWETDYAVKVTDGCDGFVLKTVPTALG
ncbi:MAG: hypothetical protein ACYSR5_05150 [Planctomycetota bacterium]|jgi:hypothetical protein